MNQTVHINYGEDLLPISLDQGQMLFDLQPADTPSVELAWLDDHALWKLAESEGPHDPLSIAEALYFNTIKRSFKVVLVSEGIPADTAQRMDFNHLQPTELSGHLAQRLATEPELMIVIVRQSSETLPIYRL